jgi:hypothetical protein
MRLSQVENLNSLLLDVPRLVDLYEGRQSTFVSETKQWLHYVERVLGAARVSGVAEVAAQRSTIIAAEHGVSPKDLVLPERSSRRRMREAVTMQSLREAQAVVSDAISEPEKAFAQGERVLRSLLALANRKGLLNDGLQPPFAEEKLKGLWALLVADPDIGESAGQVVAMTGYRDALLLTQRILESWLREQNGR